MPVLDTNFLIAAAAGQQEATELLARLQTEPLLVPSIVAVEFLAGRGQQAATLGALQAGYHVLHTTDDWVALAARHRAALRGKKGRAADFWIACWALLHGTYVVTQDVAGFEALGVKAVGW